MTMGKEEEGERAEGFVRAPIYSVIHLPVVDVMCVLFWTQSVCMVPKQNTHNIYHKQMNTGVCCIPAWADAWRATLVELLCKYPAYLEEILIQCQFSKKEALK